MKIKTIHSDDLNPDLLKTDQPLLIKSLFDEYPLRQMDTADLACKYLPFSKLRVIQDYIELFEAKKQIEQIAEAISLQDYVKHMRSHPTTQLRIRDFFCPKEFEKFLPTPSFCRENTNEPISKTVLVGPQGAVSNLHIDNDQNHVFLYQVFGRKRAIIFSPSVAEKLLPVANLSFWKLDQFSEAEIHAFIHFADGCQCILEPGDTLFMPKLVWHHLSYLTDGMSVNFRFGRNQYNQFMADNIHLDYLSQNLAFHLDEFKPLFESSYQCMLALQGIVNQTFASVRDKYNAISALIERWIQDHMPDLYRSKMIGFRRELLYEDEIFKMLTQPYR